MLAGFRRVGVREHNVRLCVCGVWVLGLLVVKNLTVSNSVRSMTLSPLRSALVMMRSVI